MTTPSPVPPTIYATFFGLINQDSVAQAVKILNHASYDRVQDVHILLQTAGGGVSDGLALFAYLEASPMRIHIYNGGGVSSAGVLIYLGGENRYTSAHSTFMIHRTTTLPPTPVGMEAYREIAKGLALDDARTEALLSQRTKVPPQLYDRFDFTFTAQQAIEFGVAHEIRDFKVPPGNQIFNLSS